MVGTNADVRITFPGRAVTGRNRPREMAGGGWEHLGPLPVANLPHSSGR